CRHGHARDRGAGRLHRAERIRAGQPRHGVLATGRRRQQRNGQDLSGCWQLAAFEWQRLCRGGLRPTAGVFRDVQLCLLASAGIVFDGDEGRLGEEAFLRDFAGDLPEAKAKVLYAVQEPFQKALLTGKTTNAAWRSKPSFYAVSTEDRTINPDLERFMAKRMGAKTIEVKASHLSLISQPDEITQLILEAAGLRA